MGISTIEKQVTVLLTISNESLNAGKGTTVVNRRNIRVEVAGTDSQSLGLLDNFGNPFSRVTNENNNGNSHASLTGGTEASTNEGIDGILFLGIGHNDSVVLGTHVHLASLTVVARSFVDVLTSRVTTNKRYGSNVGMSADVGDSRSTTLYNVDDTLGDTRLGKQVHQHNSSLRDLLRRLENVSVTKSNGEREHPERNHSWEVEGGNTSCNTKRNSVGVEINTSGDTLEGLTLVKGTEGASVLNNFVTSENITLGIKKRFTVLMANKTLKFISIILDELLVLEHVSDFNGDRNILPGLESFLSVSDGFVELSIGRLRNLTDDILVERVDDIVHLGTLRGTPLTVDVVFVNLGEVSLLSAEHSKNLM
mmetsp:Transcript_103693/g.143435  ORF Transcript_103693/g.143435 Transcript_103693/m.143435 type:complete len:366 (-) Transcript_103693:8-1105(-)